MRHKSSKPSKKRTRSSGVLVKADLSKGQTKPNESVGTQQSIGEQRVRRQQIDPDLTNDGGANPRSIRKIVGGIVLAVVALIGGIGGAFRNAGIVNMGVAHVLLAAALFGFLGGLLLVEFGLNLPRRRRNIIVFATILASVVFIGFVDLQMIKLKAANDEKERVSKSTSSESPYLTTSLIIDSVSFPRVDFHFEVKNGPVPVDNLTLEYRTQSISDAGDSPAFLPRDVAPNQTLSILGLPWKVFSTSATTVLLVSIYFDSKGVQTKKSFVCKYRFVIEPNELRPHQIYPQNSYTEELASRPPGETYQNFANPEGILFIVLSETPTDGESRFTRIENEQRRLLFDALALTVVFETKLSSGAIVKREKSLLKTSNGLHYVWLKWTPSDAWLIADEEGLDPENSKRFFDQ